MTTNDTLHQLTEVFREVFGDHTIIINRNTTAADIDEWDSISHIEMIVAAEAHFGIQFRSMELEKLRNVGDLVDMIEGKLAVK